MTTLLWIFRVMFILVATAIAVMMFTAFLILAGGIYYNIPLDHGCRVLVCICLMMFASAAVFLTILAAYRLLKYLPKRWATNKVSNTSAVS